MTPYRNIYSTMTRDREDKPPGSGGNPIPDPGPPGGKPKDPREPTNGSPPIPDPQQPTSSLPSAVDPGYASTASGPAGVGGSGGFGFTNLAQYMYANPTATGPGTAQSTTPTGYQSGDYNPGLHGFAPSGGYTPGMANVDNALNQVYGRTGTPSTPTLGTPPVPGGANTPTGEQPYPNIYDNMYPYLNRIR